MYADLAAGFGGKSATPIDREALEKDLHQVIGIDKLLAIERATVEKGKD